jgi:hypothetical protein
MPRLVDGCGALRHFEGSLALCDGFPRDGSGGAIGVARVEALGLHVGVFCLFEFAAASASVAKTALRRLPRSGLAAMASRHWASDSGETIFWSRGGFRGARGLGA